MQNSETNSQSTGKSWPGPRVSSFDASLVENGAEFQTDFYRAFRMRNAETPLRLDDKVTRNYLFPTLYGDVTVSIAMFFCSLKAAKKLMPDSEMLPVDMGQGRSVVIISSYHYGKVRGIGSYNEIAMSIPVLMGSKQYIPTLPMLFSDFNQLGYYVFSMPVTTLENKLRGVKLWGLPKVVQEINLRPEGNDYVTEALEESGEKYLELRVPMNGAGITVEQRADLYSVLNGSIQRSTSKTSGKFAITKFNRSFLQKGINPQRPYLWIGDTASGRVLKQLEIEPQPFQMRFGTDVSSIFDLPHAEYKNGTFHSNFNVPVAHLDDLLSCSQADLDLLYSKSVAGSIPAGESSGKAIFFPGSKFGTAFAKTASSLWQGKVFDLGKGILVNKVLGFKAIKAEVLLGKSFFDDKDAVIIDYQNTSLIASPIRDEIREIGPGLYLGRVYIRTPIKPILVGNFALDFGTNKT